MNKFDSVKERKGEKANKPDYSVSKMCDTSTAISTTNNNISSGDNNNNNYKIHEKSTNLMRHVDFRINVPVHQWKKSQERNRGKIKEISPAINIRPFFFLFVFDLPILSLSIQCLHVQYAICQKYARTTVASTSIEFQFIQDKAHRIHSFICFCQNMIINWRLCKAKAKATTKYDKDWHLHIHEKEAYIRVFSFICFHLTLEGIFGSGWQQQIVVEAILSTQAQIQIQTPKLYV